MHLHEQRPDLLQKVENGLAVWGLGRSGVGQDEQIVEQPELLRGEGQALRIAASQGGLQNADAELRRDARVVAFVCHQRQLAEFVVGELQDRHAITCLSAVVNHQPPQHPT